MNKSKVLVKVHATSLAINADLYPRVAIAIHRSKQVKFGSHEAQADDVD